MWVTPLLAASFPWTVAIPIVGVVVTPLLSYLVSRRKSSGRINTTEAATLWEEAEKMREAYREEAIQLRTEAAGLRAEVAALRGEVSALTASIAELRSEAAATTVELARLAVERATMVVELAALGEHKNDQ